MSGFGKFGFAGACASLGVVVVEVAYHRVFGVSEFKGALDGLAFLGAVLGVLGTPCLLGGAGFAFVAYLWSKAWSKSLSQPTPIGRVIAWYVYAGVSMALIGFVTYKAAVYAIGAFNKPVYQAMAPGLVAAASTALLTFLSRPIVVGLTSPIAIFLRRLPAFLNPQNFMAQVLWLCVVMIVGLTVLPIVIKPLHTVDLRPLRLVVFWLSSIWLFYHLSERLSRVARQWFVGIVTLASAACLLWTAVSLGARADRVLTLERDTILTRFVLSRLDRLADGDGDGIPGLFSGGDCDDSNPNIRPGVYDHPGDGIDQNCTGADLAKADVRTVARPRPVTGPQKDWNVVLLTVDALRADIVSEHMPNLVRLKNESIDFRNGYSHGATTYWSLPALLLSKMPSQVEMGRDQTPVHRELMLTEVLKTHGWHTALFANVTIFFVRGLRQGFQMSNYDTSHYTKHGVKPGSKHMTDAALKYLDRWKAGRANTQRKKFFLWSHYFDTHEPYFKVPQFPSVDDTDRERYLAIARHVDHEIGRLVNGLKKRGLWDKTVLIVTSDHGEEFLDHGHRHHGRTVYEEITHVPLIVRVPGIQAKPILTPIGHMDVAPTLLELLGITIPAVYEGRSFAHDLVTGQSPQDGPVFLEVFPDSNYSAHQIAMRLGSLKIIYRVNRNYFELYDLSVDPQERRNIIDDSPDTRALKVQLLRYVDRHLFTLAQGRSGALVPRGTPGKPKRGAP